jgi:hypothetical protein
MAIPTTRTKPDTRVTWRDGYKPETFPATHGTLFMVKGDAAWVTWDGTDAPLMMARKALTTV